jgi:DNA polymerase I
MSNYILITGLEEFEAMIDQLKAEPWLVIELLATGTDPEKDAVVGWTLAGGTSPDIFYLPMGAPLLNSASELPADLIFEQVGRLIGLKALVGYDLYSMVSFLKEPGSKPHIVIRSDVMVEAYLKGRFHNIGLSYLAKVLYGADLFENKGIYQTSHTKIRGSKTVYLHELPTELAFLGACKRVHYIKRIHNELFPEICNDLKLKKLHQLEVGILPIAAEMMETGIRIDFDQCRLEYSRLTKEAEALSKSFHSWIQRNYGLKDHFDFGSSSQTADLLIDKLNLVKEVRTAKGHRTTSKKVYEGFRDSSPAINAIYTYRELVKVAAGSFGLYPNFRGDDGRIHPRLLTNHVLSGRTASADPSCHQIPKESNWQFIDFDDSSADLCANCFKGNCPACLNVKKKGLRAAVREVFIPREGYMFVEGDFNQVELRVLAGVAGEEIMLQAFKQGNDLHRQTASHIFSVPINQVNSQQRKIGKVQNFRVVYGGGPGGLADQLGIPLDQAYEISKSFKKAYPLLDAFSERSAKDAKENGFVETLFGRRRYMDDFQATDPKGKSRGRRLAVNLKIQGGAADIGKIGLVRQDRARREFDHKYCCKTYLINFIHDSFTWEVPIIFKDGREQEMFLREFIDVMKGALCFNVGSLTGISQFPQLVVDFKLGKNYHAMLDEAEWFASMKTG